ncbi:MAG: hypothetical protein WA939_12550 [Nodosilinea sp.]
MAKVKDFIISLLIKKEVGPDRDERYTATPAGQSFTFLPVLPSAVNRSIEIEAGYRF